MSSNFNNSRNFNSGQNFTNSTYSSTTNVAPPTIERILLPTQVIEKQPAIHEEIRKELVEEVQPVVNVEKLKTEVHQVTQPLFDKEVRAVQIQNRTLATEVLPEVRVEGRGAPALGEFSTTRYLDTATVTVEKPALYNEIEKKQIIEEIQPVVYKETIVPTVIQETKPIYQKVVEGPVYSSSVLPAKEVANRSQIAETYVTDSTVIPPVRERVFLPTQIVEKPTAVHEEIRQETIEEVQPVWNVEKLKTEVHQITAPLYDKEIKPVMIEKKVLNTEILPEVLVEGRGVRAVEDFSTTRYLDTKTTLVEKPAIYNEVERTQVIEEIQPILYKETVVPTVIRETKPVFQKIVEGPVYTQQTLPPRSLAETNYRYPNQNMAQPGLTQNLPQSGLNRGIAQPLNQNMGQPIPVSGFGNTTQNIPIQNQTQQPQLHGRKEIVEEVTTTTTTTTTAPIVGGGASANQGTQGNQANQSKQHHGLLDGLLHRHQNTNAATNTNATGSNWNSGSNLNKGINTPVGDTQHFHNERVGPNGQKIIEDTTTTHQHTEQVLPTRLI